MKKVILCGLIIFSTITSIYSQSSWIQQNSGTNRYLIDMYFLNPNIGYVVGENGTILKTTNGGSNWSTQVSGTNYTLFSVFFTDSNTGYIAGTYFGGLKTTNGGSNWYSMSYNQSPSYQICFLNSQTGFSVGAGNQVEKTTNAGLNWIFKNVNSSASFYSLYFLNTDTGFVGNGNGEVFKTTDGGDSWIIYNPGVGAISSNSLYFINYNTGFVTGYYGYITDTKKTTNSGINWFYPSANQLQCYWSFDFLNSSTGYALGSSNDTTYYMYHTKNSGSNWDVIFADTSYTNYLNRVKFTNEYTGYAIGWDGIILKTTNGGFPAFTISGTIYYQDNNQAVNQGYVKAVYLDKNTSQIITVDSSGIQSNGTYTLHHVPQDSIYIMAYDDDETRPLYVPTYYPSTTTWQNATVLYPTVNLTNIDVHVYRISNTQGAMHIGGGVYTSSLTLTGLNNSIVYAKIGNVYKGFGISGSTGSYRIDSLSSGSYTIVCDRLGYIGGTKNISLNNINQDTVNFYLQKIIGITPPIGDPFIPSSFKLFQNYPNPFNPNTSIRFWVHKSGNIKLAIYDIIGREVAVLIDEYSEPGYGIVEWNGTNFASGVYFYRYTADGFSDTKKMVLMK